MTEPPTGQQVENPASRGVLRGGNKKRGGLSACPSLLSPGRSPASSAGDARLSLLVWLQAAGFPSPNG